MEQRKKKYKREGKENKGEKTRKQKKYEMGKAESLERRARILEKDF